jgi:hypothetical protein
VLVLAVLLLVVRIAWGAERFSRASVARHRPLIRAAGFGAALLIVSLVGRGVLPGIFGYTVRLGDYRMILYALALILMMIARPQGLFGVREIWERAAWEWLGIEKRKGVDAPV